MILPLLSILFKSKKAILLMNFPLSIRIIKVFKLHIFTLSALLLITSIKMNFTIFLMRIKRHEIIWLLSKFIFSFWGRVFKGG